MTIKVLLPILSGLMLMTAPVQAESAGKSVVIDDDTQFELVRSYYTPDKMPLEDIVLGSEDTGTVIREQIKFRGFDREWVTATFARPKDIQNPPVVLLLHGLTQSKAQWWRDQGQYSFPSHHRQVLIENGIAVLALDARNHGPRIEKKDFASPFDYLKFQYFEAARKMVAETALDVRRAIDYLETRKDVDASRLGVAGFSLGAYVGWIATAVDDRIDRTLLMALPFLPGSKQGRMSFTDPAHFLRGLRSRNILMAAATKDTFYTPPQMTALFDKIPTKSKELVWFESTHDLPNNSAELSKRFFVGKF